MIFDIEVKVSLKEGMLNPEATTIERSLALLGYDVKNAKTVDIIKSEKRISFYCISFFIFF